MVSIMLQLFLDDTPTIRHRGKMGTYMDKYGMGWLLDQNNHEIDHFIQEIDNYQEMDNNHEIDNNREIVKDHEIYNDQKIHNDHEMKHLFIRNQMEFLG